MALSRSSISFELDDNTTSRSAPQLAVTSELGPISSHRILTEDQVDAPHLQPADGGVAAWRLLCAAFVFEALLWGEHHHMAPLLRRTLLSGFILVADPWWAKAFRSHLKFFKTITLNYLSSLMILTFPSWGLLPQEFPIWVPHL
jgi:hypothetical protein